jgi:UDP-N-acetylmuramate dehydrogenase
MKLQKNIALKPHHSFACEEIASFFTLVTTREGLMEAIEWAKDNGQPYLILGAGSNILFTKQFDGLVIKMGLQGIQKIQETSSEVLLKVGAGENWSHFVSYCVQKSWGGLENLSLIPGTVGATPIKNMSAYGVEVGEHIVSVEAFDTMGNEWVTLNQEDCAFVNASSIFNQDNKRYIICAVQFKLSKQPLLRTEFGAIKSVLHDRSISNPSVESIAGAVIFLRLSQWPDPKKMGNAGQFFKHPMISKVQYDHFLQAFPSIRAYPINDLNYEIEVEWLIESCGWKGVTVDQVSCFQNQLMVIVNKGATKGKLILDFYEAIKQSVFNKFGLNLESAISIV